MDYFNDLNPYLVRQDPAPAETPDMWIPKEPYGKLARKDACSAMIQNTG